MAKSKNHTTHNQPYKAHKNGIKQPKRHRTLLQEGYIFFNILIDFLMNQKFLRNQMYARKHNKKGEESDNEEK
ncbi:hypothetical protein GQ457_09G012250 [Hibiscus cannabinus]